MSVKLTNKDVRLEFAGAQAWWGSPEELGKMFDTWLESVKKEAYDEGYAEGKRTDEGGHNE